MRPSFCPQCNEPLSRPGGATSLVCPVCSTVVAPEGAGLTNARPSPPAAGRGKEPTRPPVEPWERVIQPLGRAWRVVYFGLGLLKWGTVAALAALASNVIVVLAASYRPAAVRATLPTDDHVGLLAVAVPSALAAVFSLVGRLCCCSVPAASGARLAAVAAFSGTVLAQLLAGLIVLNSVLLALEAASPLWLLPAVFASGGAALVAEVLFLVFLYQVGRFLPEPAVGRRVVRLMIVAALVVVGVVLAVSFLALSAAASPAGPGTASALAGRALLAWFAVVFGVALVLAQYLDLLVATRHALARRFARDAARRAGA